MICKRILPLLIAILLSPVMVLAQNTTSSIGGVAKNADGNPMVGATVTATHEPSGTIYRGQTRAGGQFDLQNVNPGGPYTIEVTFVNFEPQRRSDIFLNLGETSKQDFVLFVKGSQLTEVTVLGTRRATDMEVKGGTGSTIGRDKMENLPTVGRNLSDYLRATPQIKISGAGNAASEGAMSFAGQNVRYNSFYIDGAVNNDVFGLAYAGTNGGQSGIAPISIDAIDQFQVLISPYSASVGNFTGAAINAITKSGTNTLHGSAYYIFRNEKLSGKTPTGPKNLATRLSDFGNKTYGFTLGGPIVKCKLFYFISGELQRDQTPNPFDFSTYQGDTKDRSILQKLVDTIAARGGGYNPGGFENNIGEVKSERFTGKLDWNINPKNKLALSYRYTGGTRVLVFASTPTTINFNKSGYTFPSKTNSASAELKSSFGKFSNRLLLTFTNVEDDRGPIGGGDAFPAVQITDGGARIIFGTEASSTFNYLKQSTYNLVDHFRFNFGKHYFTTGVEAESYKAYNTFIQNTAGNYQYNTLQDFFDNRRPVQYIANFPLIGGKDEKNTNAAANFTIFKGAAFINDEIRANKDLTFTVGVRADYYKFLTKPIADPFAIDSAMPKFAQYYDLKGTMPGQKPSVPVSISPRFGFTYNIPSENLTVRGGVGWFAGRIPLVWPGGVYNNTGVSSGGYTVSQNVNTAIYNRDIIRFRTTPYTPAEVTLSLDNAKNNLNLMAKEFKMPKVFRSSIAFDKRYSNGWSTSYEAMFTKNVNDIYYQNINLIPPTLTPLVGPDQRKVYNTSINIPIRSNGLNPYSGAYLIQNAEGQKPFSYNFTASVNKSTRTGFNMSISYNYGDSYVLNEAQSSTNNSQWSSQETVNGRNFVDLSRSDNSGAHRVFAYASKRFTYANKKASTTVTLTYTGQSGNPFSYVYSGQIVRDGINFNDLIFVPTTAQLQTMTFTTLAVGANIYSPQVQRDALDNYIQNDKYLRNRRGQYAERNGSRTPFTNVVDLKVAQAFNVKLSDKTYSMELGYSMFNFTNFLNREWGRQYIVANDNFSIMNFSYTSTSNLTPRYTFNPTTPTPETVYARFNPTYTARWMSQIELRVKF